MSSKSHKLAKRIFYPDPAFGNAARCLATASESLSTAAQALAEAAQVLSERSRTTKLSTNTNHTRGSHQLEYVTRGASGISDNEDEYDMISIVGASGNYVSWMSGHSTEAFGAVHMPAPRGNNIVSVQPSSALHYYITLQDDFDALPLIAYFTIRYRKTICFIAHYANFALYQKILRTIGIEKISRPGTRQEMIDKAIVDFTQSDSRLLLLQGDNRVSPVLGQTSVDAVIHWGFPLDGFFIPQIKLPNSTQTILILPLDERFLAEDSILQANGVVEYPDSNRLTALAPTSPLSSLREQTLAVLRTIKLQNIKVVYMSQLTRSGASQLEVVRRANRFVARVLLHGNSDDGSVMFKPVSGRPSVKASFVESQGLQFAVSQGLVHVG
ncbi:hypothetical protein BDV93DRAFT_612223 [Ceratobasidium sp. AG-I]|nr:hypothetical protein BDV93DRAFT_612223 [Ceratobasidium sp. AG-I]